MKNSLSYYIILMVLKLKGIKKMFSQDPIDFKKVRKDNVLKPKETQFKNYSVETLSILDSRITTINQKKVSHQLVIFIHGGAFISGPVQHHWDTLKTIVDQTTQNVWMCDYPKAPENTISIISKNIDAVYTFALENYSANEITLIGDSVGGTLITALVQRLVIRGIERPQKIILVSPVMDASLTNPAIEKIDKTDPMLSKKGILSAKKMCAEKGDLKSPEISPLFGSFDNFPKTFLYIGTNDITYPDQKLTEQKLMNARIDFKVIEGENMPHIWPFLPVMKEAKIALNFIIKELQ